MWSGPVGRSPVSIRKRPGSSVACSSMRASRIALWSRAAAYVALSSDVSAVVGVVAVLVVVVVALVGVVLVTVVLADMVSPVVGRPTRGTDRTPCRQEKCEEPPVGGSGYRVGSTGRLSWAATTRGSVRRSNSCQSGYATRTRSATRVTHRLGRPGGSSGTWVAPG